MSLLREFFEDDNGKGSMTKLLVFGAFCISSYAVVENVHTETIPQILAWYSGTFVVALLAGKGIDATKSVMTTGATT